MALVVKDRVKQTTTTTGTGSLVLNGTVDSFQTFTSALTNADTTYYALVEPSTNSWEVGLGTWTESTTTLARTTILESSNSGSAINLTAGEAEVFITQPAEKAVYLDANGNISIAGTVDGRDISTDGTKLDGIEAGATVDQTASEILTAIKTVDGSGSGLDADTVDGVHADALKQAVNATALTSSDSIDSVTDGWYRWHNSSPTGAYADYMVMVQSTDGAQPTQLTFGTTAHIIAVRRKDSGTWSSWAKMWSNENDGSGSGLNADLLDGNHATAFATAAQGTLADSAVQPNDSPTFGNITVTGTVDGRDVAADGTKLDGIEAGADVTDTTNVTSAGALMTTGGTMTGDVAHGDNVKAIFGASNDLTVYHDGSNSFIIDQGAGSLRIQTDGAQVKLYDQANSNIMADFNTGGSVDLYHNGSKKLATTSTGIDLTGDIAVTGTVDGRDIATNIPASLGTAGQVLTVNAGATAAEWADASASADITTVTPSGTTYTLDLSQGTHFDLGEIKADSTINVSNIPASGSFSFLFEADYFYNSVITWASDFDWKGGPAPTLVTNRKQVFSVIKDAGSSQLNSVNVGDFTSDAPSAPFFVGSAGNTSNNGGAVSVDLTSITDLAEDDLVIAFTGKGDAGTAMPGNVTSSGWTQLGQNMVQNDTEDTAARVWYKFMGATPDTDFDINSSGGADASQGVICYAVRGADLTTPFDGVTPTFNQVPNTVLSNPPSITPSGIERLIVAAGFGASNNAVGTYASSDLSDFLSVSVSDAANIIIGVGNHTQVTSSAFDPAAFTYTEADGTAFSNVGFTCVIKPAGIS